MGSPLVPRIRGKHASIGFFAASAEQDNGRRVRESSWGAVAAVTAVLVRSVWYCMLSALVHSILWLYVYMWCLCM